MDRDIVDTIIFKDGIYTHICVPHEKLEELRDKEILYAENWDESYDLYGGRVKLTCRGDVKFTIDGINIDFGNPTPYSTAANFLNQIEQCGIDVFLEKYKETVEILKEKLEKEKQELEFKQQQEDDENEKYKIGYDIQAIKRRIDHFLFIFLLLLMHYPTGIELSQYTNIYNDIITLYSL